MGPLLLPPPEAIAETLYLECLWEGPTSKIFKYEFTLNPGSQSGSMREANEAVVRDVKVRFASDVIVADYKEKTGPSYFWVKYEISRTDGSMLWQNKFLANPATQEWDSVAWSRPNLGFCKKITPKTIF